MPDNLTEKILVQPLPRARRRFVFVSLFLFFLLAVPVFVFYATGYRYDFFNIDGASITTTGGLYITVGSAEGQVFLNESPVRDMRIFRSAIYIQNLVPGMQHVHVQATGLQTWVKDLPVYPYIVTEAESFSLPVIPQIRPITEFTTATGTLVFPKTSSTTVLFEGVSTTVPFVVATTTSTSSLIKNSEYTLISGLFSTSTDSSTLLNRVVDVFSFRTTPDEPVASTTEATTTKMADDLVLSRRGEEIFVTYVGPVNAIPYYFCVPKASLASTSEIYGEHVMLGVLEVLEMESTSTIKISDILTDRTCRRDIRIDRQWQKVISFDFFPSSTDLIVLHREDGISVVEVDDRSWQNTQMLYSKPVDELVVNNGRVYARHGKMIFEILTALPVL